MFMNSNIYIYIYFNLLISIVLIRDIKFTASVTAVARNRNDVLCGIMKNHIRKQCPSTQDTVPRPSRHSIWIRLPELKHIYCLKVLTKGLSGPCSLTWQKIYYSITRPVAVVTTYPEPGAEPPLNLRSIQIPYLARILL